MTNRFGSGRIQVAHREHAKPEFQISRLTRNAMEPDPVHTSEAAHAHHARSRSRTHALHTDARVAEVVATDAAGGRVATV